MKRLKNKGFDKLREECAVFGVSYIDSDEAVGTTYNALLCLQHRGQEAAGIASIVEGDGIRCYKNIGAVGEVFTNEVLAAFPKSNIAIGHTRYSSAGAGVKENVAPFVTEYLTGRIATAHNGNVTNAAAIKRSLKKGGLFFDSTTGSEVVSKLFAYHILLQKERDDKTECVCNDKESEVDDTIADEGDFKWQSLVDGVVKAAKLLRGSFSQAVATSEGLLIAIRDPNGFRPLCIGKNSQGLAVASESCALDACGFEFYRDVLPGEIVVIDKGKIIYEQVRLGEVQEKCGLCIFEYVYFARPDSVIDGQSVYKARYNMGRILAKEYPVDADVVCGVPDSGLEAAVGYSVESGIPLVSGFVKNRYMGRSFIYPTQSQRENAVRLKLNPLLANIKDKKVVLVDDSIVRGTTSEKIIRTLLKAGAKEVHMRISSPPFVHTCYYGTDIGDEKNLIANLRTIPEIVEKIGAESLGYISVEGLKEACGDSRLKMCTGCFTGH